MAATARLPTVEVFAETLARHGVARLDRALTTTLQVNVISARRLAVAT